MKKVTRSLAAFLVLATCSMLIARDDVPAAKFADEQKRFELTIPTGWEKTPVDQPQAVVALRAPSDGDNDKFAENVNVVVVELPKEAAGAVTLNEIIDAGLEQLKQQMKAELVGDVEDFKLDDHDAKRAELKIEKEGKEILVQQTYALENNTLYVITYTHASDTSEPTNAGAKAIVDSFTFLDGK